LEIRGYRCRYQQLHILLEPVFHKRKIYKEEIILPPLFPNSPTVNSSKGNKKQFLQEKTVEATKQEKERKEEKT
jgi:hypothetical protein